MSWVVYVALWLAVNGAVVMAGVRRRTALWHWWTVGLCVVLAGWSFMAGGPAATSVMWLVLAGCWVWPLRRRLRSLREADEGAV